MKLKSSKTSKPVATSKVKTSSTKGGKSRTPSKRTTSPIWSVHSITSNLKDTLVTLIDGSCHVSGTLTPTSNCEFYLQKITQSGRDLALSIRSGRKGLVLERLSDGRSLTIGWDDILCAISDPNSDGMRIGWLDDE